MLADQNVFFIHNQITPAQVELYWVLYINSILVQFCEWHCQNSCAAYYIDWSEFFFFTECCCLSEHFNEVCDNCKWQNYAAQCSVQNRENNDDDNRDNLDNRDLVFIRQHCLSATAEKKTENINSNIRNLIILW